MNVEPAKKISKPPGKEHEDVDSDMSDEYDFRGGVRGKYVHRLTKSIERNMIPKHAQEMWDTEKASFKE